MPEIIKTDALILRTRDYSEADQLLTIYTQKAGKLTAIAKGVKKPKSKLRGGIQLFSYTNLSLYPGKNLATVTQAEPINSFLVLREDLIRLGYASYLAEFIDNIIPEAEVDESIFALSLVGFYLLSIEDPWITTRVLETRFFLKLGYQPQMEYCVNCGKKPDKGIFFIPELGGIACSNCKKVYEEKEFIKISGETRVLLEKFNDIDFKNINRLRISYNAKKEIDKVLELYVTNIIGKELKSKEFLKSLA